ncbi:MAG: hypothetical protein V3V96_11350 [Acidiferrobacterales bacterium]
MTPCFSRAASSTARLKRRLGQLRTIIRSRVGEAAFIDKHRLGNNALLTGARYNAPLIYACINPV